MDETGKQPCLVCRTRMVYAVIWRCLAEALSASVLEIVGLEVIYTVQEGWNFFSLAVTSELCHVLPPHWLMAFLMLTGDAGDS